MKAAIVGIIAAANVAAGANLYAELADLPVDASGRLLNHMVIFNENCVEQAEEVASDLRPSGLAVGTLAEALELESSQAESCHELVCLEKGTQLDLVPHWNSHQEVKRGDLRRAMTVHGCNKLEVGFISNYPTEETLTLNWVHPTTGEEQFNGKLDYGEKSIHWITSFLGHEFVARTEGGELIQRWTMAHNGVYLVGTRDTRVGLKSFADKDFKRTFDNEWRRHDKVVKRYSEQGFGKGKLPPDAWGSIGAYYHNNKPSFVREQWDKSGGLFVNWWEADVDILLPPWKLKKSWQRMLMPQVQRWFGSEPLEPTDIYGMRRYTNGSRLIMHVDREKTHALSMIINVDQLNLREEWAVEINNHNDETHNVVMGPGEVVYYESAACLHGRMRPLMGDGYVNLFVHYRPIGDDEWYTRPGGLADDEVVKNSPDKFYEMRSKEDLFNLWKGLNAPLGLHTNMAAQQERLAEAAEEQRIAAEMNRAAGRAAGVGASGEL